MVCLNKPGDALLGCEFGIDCMKFDPASRPLRKNLAGQERICYPFNITRGGEAEIKKLMPDVDDDICVLNEKSIHLRVGDIIDASNIYGFSDKLTKKPTKGKNPSGRHSRQQVTVKGSFCYAVIVTSWSKENLTPHPKEALSGNSGNYIQASAS